MSSGLLAGGAERLGREILNGARRGTWGLRRGVARWSLSLSVLRNFFNNGLTIMNSAMTMICNSDLALSDAFFSYTMMPISDSYNNLNIRDQTDYPLRLLLSPGGGTTAATPPVFFSFSLAANLNTSTSLANQRRNGSGWNTPSFENHIVNGASKRLSWRTFPVGDL